MWLNKSVEYTYSDSSAPETDNENFRKLIVTELIAAGSQITAVTNDVYSVLICGKLKLTFSAASISNLHYIKITASYGESNSYDMTDIYVNPNSPKVFRLNFHIAADTSGKIIDVKVRNFATAATSLNFNQDMLYMLTDDNTAVFGYTSSGNSSAATTRNFASSSLQNSYTMQNRMPYIHDSDSTKLDTISGKVLTVGGIRAEHVGGMLDSTYIAGDGLYPSGSDQYYAVDDYSLIKV